jgi:hypothetical protein
VAQDVDGDGLVAKRGAGDAGAGDVDGEAAFERVAAEWGAAAGGEQRVGGVAVVRGEPGA